MENKENYLKKKNGFENQTNSVYLRFTQNVFKLVHRFVIINFGLCLLLINCTQSAKKEEVHEDGIPEIDIMANLSNSRIVNLSTIASSIEYCALETDKKCLVTPYMSVYPSNDKIITMGSSGSDYGNRGCCYVFDRFTGKFIREISQIGQGPEDYQMTVSVLSGNKGQICLLGNNQYLFFNLDGTLSHKMKNSSPYISWLNITAYEDMYVGYVFNRRGNSTIRIAFVDKTGELIDSIPNYRFYEKPDGGSTQSGGDFSFHVLNDSLYYKDIYCDTLFQIKDFALLPRYIFNTGGQTVPYEAQIEGRYDVQAAMADRKWDRYEKYLEIKNILEDAKSLYLTFEFKAMRYKAIYHKEKNDLQILPPVALPFSYQARMRFSSLDGLENDLDGGLPFWPQQMISDKVMMCVYTAEELLALDTLQITDTNLKNTLKNLKYDDNPIVAIVTIK